MGDVELERAEIDLLRRRFLRVVPAPRTAGAVRALLDNATKYGDGTTTVRIAEVGATVLVEVSDPGAGVPAGEAELLFEPFFRTERAVLTAAGLGLGLPVARRLIEHEGGTVEVRAVENAGTTATIRLKGGR